MSSEDLAPGWITALFRLVVPRGMREEMEGDLHEGYRRVRREDGLAAAHLWACRQLLSLRPRRLRSALRGVPEVSRILGGGHPSSWAAHFKYAARALRVRPGASLTVVGTIAVALGITTGVFSVVHGVLLNPLPYPDSDGLVRVWQTRNDWVDSPNRQLRSFALRFPLSTPTFDDWTREDFGLESLGAYTGAQFVVQGTDGAELVRGESVTSGVMEALQIPALLGRTLLPEDDPIGAPRTAVLAYGFWMNRYGGRADVLGTTLTLDGDAHTIVGVMPPEFRALTSADARLWTPLPEESKAEARDSQYLSVVGRLAPGVTMEAASTRLASLQARLAEEYPDEQGDVGSRMTSLLDAVVGDMRSTLWFLFGSVALVLLIACANIANVLSVLGLTRRREMAVKAALGASTGRLVRGLLAETLVLCGLGGLFGLLLAWLSLPLLLRLIPASVPRYEEIGIDGGVLAFGILLTLLTAILVGLLPALQTARTDPSDMLRKSGRGMTGERSGNRIRSALVSAEVALAFVLLIGAGLLGTSFLKLWSVDRGFATESLIVLRTSPDPSVYPEPEDRDQFVSELQREFEAIPGVQVSASNQVPLSGTTSTTTFEIERDGSEPDERSLLISVVLENYFDVMEIPLVEGRGFETSDAADAPPVAVVSRSLADAIWPGQSPLGQRLRDNADDPWATVVGVARDVRHSGLEVEPELKIYAPVWQNHRHPSQWVIRARGDVAGVVDLARQAVGAVSPSTAVRGVRLMEQHIARSVAVPRFRTLFVVGLALMAALLALLGVYSVVTFAVTQRTREIGVRMALGARADHVVRQVVGSGLKLAIVGIVAGSIIAYLLAETVSGFLFEVEATDPLTYVGIAVGVSLVSALAAFLPARRAAGIDPMRVLNSD